MNIVNMCYNNFMKRHVFWLIELFIWLFVIIFIIFGVRFYNAKKAAKESTYHIFLQDIDGLMKGSPVKLMGVQIGYVTEINVIDDYMYVSFLVSKKDTEIPHGSKALIESYGIAGSKSIELYPPKNKADESKSLIFVEKPIRASSAFLTQNEISKTLITVANGATSIIDMQTAEQHKRNIQKLAELSGKANFDVIDEKSDEMINKIKNSRKQKEIKEDENE